jgi:hypothetical protein
MKLYSLPPGDLLHSQVDCTLGIILSGKRALHHIVLIQEDDLNPIYNDFQCFTDVIFACDSNLLMNPGISFTLDSSDMLEPNITLLGVNVHSNGFSFVGLKPFLNAIVTTTSTVDLLQKVANMSNRPKRKHSMIAPVFLKGVGQLHTHTAHDVAHAWIMCHAHDTVKIDFMPQRGQTNSTSLVRRFQIKNLKDEYVVVRTLKECIEYVQARTGRNFWNDMANYGDSYDTFVENVKNLKKNTSSKDVDCHSTSITTHPSDTSPADTSLCEDLFGSDVE